MIKVSVLQILAVVAFQMARTCRALIVTPACHRMPPSSTCLSMGILDSISSFLQDREGDFVKLEDSGTAVGPGPLLLLFNLPPTILIESEEVKDMVEDGAPKAFQQGVIISRISSNNAEILDKPLLEALQQIVDDAGVVGVGSDSDSFAATGKSSVLYFSGFSNEEMMSTFNIIGKEICEETGGSIYPACAKAVEKAMEKPLRQVLDEISGDHEEAMMSSE